jgi:CRISPR-associated protein Csm5
VEDSAALPPSQHLQLFAISVYPTADNVTQQGLDIDVETVKAGTAFHTNLTVEEYGFQPQVADRLGWKGKRAWLDRLPALARQHALQRIEAELDYFRQPGRPVQVLRAYEQLRAFTSSLGQTEFVLQMGWGTGWESKTLGSELLRQDDRAFERLLTEYRMTKDRGRQPGDAFPKSRHLVLSSKGQLIAPLGWVKVTMG